MNDMIVKSVDLMGDAVMAAQDSDGTIWVGIKWMCQGMGMSDGQYKRQITNIQKDLLLKNSGSNLLLNKGSGEREVFCLKLDYLPIWLAKISITPTIQKSHPELADKLLNYQLKAKDILAAAFLPQPQLPQTTMELLELHYKALKEVDSKVATISAEVGSVREDLESLKMDLPILPIEAEKITNATRAKGVSVMGGKNSNAYANRSIVNAVYKDIYGQIYRNFGVSTYKAIKRNQTEKVLLIIEEYKPPVVLQDRIDNENAQQKLNV